MTIPDGNVPTVTTASVGGSSRQPFGNTIGMTRAAPPKTSATVTSTSEAPARTIVVARIARTIVVARITLVFDQRLGGHRRVLRGGGHR